MNRRNFMKISGAAAGLVLIPVSQVNAADTPAKLGLDDPQAKGLGYVETSAVAGSNCANCAQSKGAAGDKWLGCNIFPAKQVSASGWCKVWSKRA